MRFSYTWPALAFLLLLFPKGSIASGAVKPPYTNNFDLLADTAGWSHYAITGADDWQWGAPNGLVLNTALSSPNVWGTNLTGTFTANSVMALETPYFDFTDTTRFMLCFLQEYESAPYHGGNIEYSLDSGKTWTILNGASNEKYNWYNNNAVPILNNQPAWSGNGQFYFAYAAHSLVSLKGKPSVKFRFKFGGSTNPLEGWVIDNFAIIPEGKNIVATQGTKIETSKYKLSVDVSSTLVYSTFFPTTYTNTTNYYFSYDKVYDFSDAYLGNKVGNISGTTILFNKTVNIPSNLNVGSYYILYQHDANDVLTGETSDTDNWNYAEVQIDTTYEMPANFDFESGPLSWKGKGSPNWVHGPGLSHHIDNAHSGLKGWSVAGGNSSSCVVSPFVNIQGSDTLFLSGWYKNISGGSQTLMYSIDGGIAWNLLNTIQLCNNDDWDFFNFPLASVPKFPFLKFAFFSPNMLVDDIYIGKAYADLSVEDDRLNRNTSSGSSVDSIKYQLTNSGLKASPQCITAFYWSADSLLDASDTYLGSKSEAAMAAGLRTWTWFGFTKPTTNPGRYYIHFVLDTANSVAEMREGNNKGYFQVYQSAFPTVPYLNDFETQVDGWRHNATLGKDDWRWSTPNLVKLSNAFSGTKTWVTNANSLLSPMSRMHLYTPAFDFSSAVNPVLEFDMKLHSHQNCFCFEGKTNMSYSIDGGATWKLLDTVNQSYNRWYYGMEYYRFGGFDRLYYIPLYTNILFAPSERAFAPVDEFNSRDVDRNTRYILDVGALAGQPRVQFRFNTATLTNTFLPVEGAIVDNFSVREKFVDLNVNYKKALMMSSIAGEVKFQMNIKNEGNYISKPCSTKYYLSADTVLGGNDYLLYNDYTPAIRPDFYFYSNRKILAPSNLVAYNYLIYQLDANNANAESNELNNTGWWPLALDSIESYPYKQDFADTILNGWYSYTTNKNFGILQNSWRFRNKLAPAEPLYSTGIKSGQMFTDQIDQTVPTIQVPIWMVETPSFDFSQWDSLTISFNKFSSGKTSGTIDGGCLDFSTDGGYNFLPLTYGYGTNLNWYNTASYWAGTPGVMDYSWYDINFLKGQKHVVFRFRYSSSIEFNGGGTPQGMRIDDFLIAGRPLKVAIHEKPYADGSVTANGREVYIRLPTGAEPGDYSFTIVNTLGQIVMDTRLELQSGFNHYSITDKLSAGIYIVTIRNTSHLLQEKVVLSAQ